VVRPGDVFRVDNMPFFDKPGDSFSPIELAAGDEGSDGKTPPYTPDWYVRAKGEAVGDAGGTVTLKDGRKINIEVTKNDDIQRWHDGAIVKNDQGKPATVPGLLQFKATGTDCDDCRWVQFYKNFETDKDGKPIGGLNADWNAYNFVSGNGQWVVDASHPGPGQNVDPNVIYQDQGDSLFNRSKTETSVFDRPNIKTTPETSERGADFKTYLVADGKPVWEINWKAVARPTPGQPDPSTTYEAISGKQVSQFAPELNTKTWDVGYHVKTDGDKATISRDLTKIANPFYSR
jgi:hypothetical protein